MTAPVSDPLTPRAQRLALGLLLAATLRPTGLEL